MRVIRRLFAIALVAAATAALWFAPAWLPSIGLGSAPSSSASPAPIWTVGKHSAEMVRDSRAANLQLVCPGAFVRSGGASGTKLGYFDRVAAPEIATTHWLRGAELRSTRLAGMADSAPEGNPVALEVSDPSGNLAQGSTLLSAASVQAASLVDFNGLLAAPCIAPATDSWLIGGSTQTGRESLLLLSNPGLADAQVSVSAFGPKGVIASSGLAAITVNAGQSVLVPLASDLPEAPTFALRVQSSSAPVAAWLQQRVLRGTHPGGSELLAPSTEFAARLAFAGFTVSGQTTLARLQTDANYQDATPAVRVLVPASASAREVTVTVQVFGAGRTSFGTVVTAKLLPGTATDLALPGLADGQYQAVVKADAPVAATLRVPRTAPRAARGEVAATDFAWLNTANSLMGERAFRVPNTGETRLALVNAGKQAASVAVGSQAEVQGGQAPVITLAAGESRLIKLTAGAAVWASTQSADLRGGLILQLGEAGVATLPITDFKNSPSTTRVRVF